LLTLVMVGLRNRCSFFCYGAPPRSIPYAHGGKLSTGCGAAPGAPAAIGEGSRGSGSGSGVVEESRCHGVREKVAFTLTPFR
jgi:hypothetical protein